MAIAKKLSMGVVATLLCLALLSTYLRQTEAQIGVCYGMIGNNLPSRQDVVKLYQSNEIQFMRIYWADTGALEALQGSNIKLILDVPNEHIQSLGSDASKAVEWVRTNVVPYASSIKYIAVGNEVHPSDSIAPSVRPAMQNVQNALKLNNLAGKIKVSTSIDTSLIINSYPPSNGQFSNMKYMGPIVNFLKSNGSPLLVNIYPYFSYISNENNIDINYALFTSSGTVVVDKNNGLQYQNLFDAMVDSAYAALAKAGAPDTSIVVSETGWPSNGGDSATDENAGTYYRNLINHVNRGSGTPLKSGEKIETYLFAMFDENKKTGQPSEQHFGLFHPSQQPKYQLSFN